LKGISWKCFLLKSYLWLNDEKFAHCCHNGQTAKPKRSEWAGMHADTWFVCVWLITFKVNLQDVASNSALNKVASIIISKSNKDKGKGKVVPVFF
jgi:hypothetical protein